MTVSPPQSSGNEAAIGQLLLHAIGLRIGFVDFVDRNDDRHPSGSCVIDSFERLRHHAVVGRNHQDDDIGDLGAARTHAGKGLVTRSIDEDDLATVLLDVISTDVLRDATGFAPRHIGLADGIQQRSFTVIDVAHDGDHGRPADQIGGLFGQFNVLRALLFVTDLIGGRAEFARQFFGQFDVQRLVDGGEDLLVRPAS